MSYKAYQSAQARTDTPQQTEYRLLADITRRLISIEDVKDPVAVEIVYDNIAAWSTFAADLMLPENPLPDSLKAQLISLFLWVERHSQQVLKGNASTTPLIDVNKSIMAGLSAQAGNGNTQRADEPGAEHERLHKSVDAA
jgi:flagellar protein FlaF